MTGRPKRMFQIRVYPICFYSKICYNIFLSEHGKKPRRREGRPLKEQIVRYIKIFTGTMLIVFAYVFITVPQGVITGGVSSLSMSLSTLLPLSVSALVTIITVLIAVLCFLTLGPETFKGSLFSCVTFLTMFNLMDLTTWRPNLPIWIYLPLSGVVAGVGLFLDIDSNASTIGTDTLGMIINKYFPKLSIGGGMAATSILIMLLGLATHGLFALIQGVIFTLIRTVTLNGLIKLFGRRKASAAQ